MNYEQYFKRTLTYLEKELRRYLLAHEAKPRAIHQAMQYAAFTGGKRFRPVLTLSVCEACGGRPSEAVLAALAIELIHTYSLIHDDLPALDNDDLRRGKPTCHKKFGEANAILAGDALLTLAFEWISKIKPPDRAVRILREVAEAAGTHGMIGGQVADLEAPGRKKSLAEHDFISRYKTGALIRVSAVAGAVAAGAAKSRVRAMARYGECLGLAFQVVDDILDKDGYCKMMSAAAATRKAVLLIERAKKEARRFGRKAEALVFLADFLKIRIPQ